MQLLRLATRGLALAALLMGAASCVRASAPAGVPTVVVPVAAVSGEALAVSAAAEPSRASSDGDGPAAGDRVEVEWRGSWFPAVVIERRGDRWLVRHEEAGDTVEELVGRERIRLPVAPPGEDVGEDDADP